MNATAPFSPIEDTLHGVRVRDPYRWLEDRNLPETDEWIREQQYHCSNYFSSCPGLETITHRVRDYLTTEVVDQPARVAKRYFYRRRGPNEQQACIYVRELSTGEERLLVDPSTYGPFVSIAIHQISRDGSLLAYEVFSGGAARKAICIVDVASGHTLPTRLADGLTRGFVFTPNNDGYYYCHETTLDSPDHTIHLHRFGQAVQDEIVFRVPRTKASRLVLTADEKHLGAIWFHPEQAQYLVDLSISALSEGLNWTNVFANRKAPYIPILCDGRLFILREEEKGGNSLIEMGQDGCEINTTIPDRGVPIQQILVASDVFYTSCLLAGGVEVHTWGRNGEDLGTISLPVDGTIQLLTNYARDGNDFFYGYESFRRPPVIFEYSSGKATSHVWNERSTPLPNSRCITSHLEFNAKDGTSVPLTLVHLERAVRHEPAPVIMTTYGGFGVPMTPQFSVLVTIMLEQGAIFAIPHVRGGGGLGHDWHEAGRGRKRQNSFNDFIAAAEWLCHTGVTTPRQLGIFGGCNSGLLVAVAMTQRPELFGAVLCIAPLLDMVRYESFGQAAKWQHEFGTVEDPEDFQAILSYSPYHHVEEHLCYPAAMFVTGDKDEQCDPAHARKMVARLRSCRRQTSPILLDYSKERGHSPVLPLNTRIDALARRIAFLCNELGMEVHDDKAFA